MSLAKPLLRGRLVKYFRVQVAIAGLVSVASALAYKVIVMDPREKAYAEFYKNLDVDKEFEMMREAGVFKSARPTGE